MPRRRPPHPQPTLDLVLDVPTIPHDIPVSVPSLSAAVAAAAVSLGETDPWAGSEFAWLRTLPPRTKARVGAEIVELLLRGTGYSVSPRTDPGHDRVVGSVPVVVKFSTLWSQGTYVFQKIRPGTWEQAVLLGVSPHTAHAWVVPSPCVDSNVDQGDWLTVAPDVPPDWLAPLGGTLDVFVGRLGAVFGRPVSPHGPATTGVTTAG